MRDVTMQKLLTFLTHSPLFCWPLQLIFPCWKLKSFLFIIISFEISITFDTLQNWKVIPKKKWITNVSTQCTYLGSEFTYIYHLFTYYIVWELAPEKNWKFSCWYSSPKVPAREGGSSPKCHWIINMLAVHDFHKEFMKEKVLPPSVSLLLWLPAPVSSGKFLLGMENCKKP